MAKANHTHRYIGDHAVSLGPVMVGPGDFVTLDKKDLEDPYTKELVDNGLLLDVKGGEKDA